MCCCAWLTQLAGSNATARVPSWKLPEAVVLLCCRLHYSSWALFQQRHAIELSTVVMNASVPVR
jgi:hypothetical protein